MHFLLRGDTPLFYVATKKADNPHKKGRPERPCQLCYKPSSVFDIHLSSLFVAK